MSLGTLIYELWNAHAHFLPRVGHRWLVLNVHMQCTVFHSLCTCTVIPKHNNLTFLSVTDTCTCTRTNVHTHYSENANRIRLPRINALGNNIRRDRVSNSLFATPMYIHLSFCFTILVRWTFLQGNSSIWAARAQAKLICKIYVKQADFSTLVSQSDQHTQSTLSITEWWDDQCHMFTSSCRSSAAPAFTSSGTTEVLPLQVATISGESPSCVMTDMCSETTLWRNMYMYYKGIFINMSYCSLPLDTSKPHLLLHMIDMCSETLMTKIHVWGDIEQTPCITWFTSFTSAPADISEVTASTSPLPENCRSSSFYNFRE